MDSPNPPRVLVFLSSLGSGGAENAAVSICGWLRSAGCTVCLLTLSCRESDFFSCPDGVSRLSLDAQEPSGGVIDSIFANLKRFRSIRKAVIKQRSDVVLSLGDTNNVLMLLATLGIRCRKIISERADPLQKPLSLAWRLLRWLTYPTATLHVSQSTYASDWIRERFPSLPCRVIGNAAKPRGPNVSVTPSNRGHFQFVAIGRLSQEKGMDLLLSAFAMARTKCSLPIRLAIAGDGRERGALEAQINGLLLGDSVVLLGQVSDVTRVLLDADAFVIPSRWEGFPNAMMEAMAFGMPIIAAKCRGGIEDVLSTCGEPCALTFAPGDTGQLADRLIRIAEDSELRRSLAARALQRSEDYSPAVISAAWREVVIGQ